MSPLLEVRELVVDYGSRSDLFSRTSADVRAVDHVDLTIDPKTTLGLVGESGSGKTSVARAIVGLVRPVSGEIRLLGQCLTCKNGSFRLMRRHVQMVFQQPTSSLDPRMRIGGSVAEPLFHLLGMRGRALSARVAELLELVGLEADHSTRYPRQLSGGQRQRVAIARAIATSPELVICDEPTSSLDVSVQAQIVNLLLRLQEQLGISYLFISHDLGLVRQIADFVAVMHRGSIIESGPVDVVLRSPKEDYTKALLDAVPTLDRINEERHGPAWHRGSASGAPAGIQSRPRADPPR